MAQPAGPGLGRAGGAVHKAGIPADRGRIRAQALSPGHRARRDGAHPSEARNARRSTQPFGEAPLLRTRSMGDTTARNGGD